MEFKLQPLEENKPIVFNFEELKTELTQNLEKYEGLVFTEETIKDAKDTRANLNKLKTAIEDKRKEVKKHCLKPYDAFESQIKELTCLIDSPISKIDTQIKSFEEKQKETKYNEITSIYDKSINGLRELLPLEKIFNDKWLNSTYKISNIEKEIIETVGKVNGDLSVIDGLKLDADMLIQVKDKYLQTLDFGLAMAEKTRLENLKAELSKVTEQNNCHSELYKVNHRAEGDVCEPVSEAIAECVSASQETVSEYQPNERLYTRYFYVKGTKEQLISLADYLDSNNIEYGAIKGEEQCQQLQTV